MKSGVQACEWLVKGCDCSPTEARKCYERNKEFITQNQPRNYIGKSKESKQ